MGGLQKEPGADSVFSDGKKGREEDLWRGRDSASWGEKWDQLGSEGRAIVKQMRTASRQITARFGEKKKVPKTFRE